MSKEIENNTEQGVLPKGTIVKVGGIPCELLEEAPILGLPRLEDDGGVAQDRDSAIV